ncbi:SWEET family sugar transporter [Bombilactobacillus folatiphilus]|uniref:SWEET family sugar transporter n=1 Tax=Bombilactobacillus folatiphilus TaxID=2923362 RepID=A0ABY4P9I6_9LACO|nr:SWEET family sugar transporter [Bombilactobacillus folatiphilus]UQS82047.1 SWEET family sugar transporter [Bombilactobacillus folatiphilus]
MKSNKFIPILGWIASVASILMYVSYIPQIINNLHGLKGNPIQPTAALLNGLLWVIYALCKEERDIPIAVCNAAGFIFGLIAALTAL